MSKTLRLNHENFFCGTRDYLEIRHFPSMSNSIFENKQLDKRSDSMKIKTVFVNEYTPTEYDSEEDCLESELRYSNIKIWNKKYHADPSVSVYDLLINTCPKMVMYLCEEKTTTLKTVNRDKKIVIRHWQCSEKPVYSCTGLQFTKYGAELYFCGTDVLPYGSAIGVNDLLRYLENQP